MKRTVIFILATVFLITSLSLLSSCSRRKIYEEQSEEHTTAADDLSLSTEYDTPIILQSGNGPYYADKSIDDLEILYLNTSQNLLKTPMMVSVPTGLALMFDQGDGQMYFYNKKTENVSTWCADPLCTHQLNECIWVGAEIEYMGKQEIVFKARLDGNTKLYICDLQRNHIREIYDIADYSEECPDGSFNGYSDMVIVEYVYDGRVYIEYEAYSENGTGVSAVYTIDINTSELKKCFDIPKNVSLQAWISDAVYYLDSSEGKIYRADLNLENTEFVVDGREIVSYTERYLVIGDVKEGDRYSSASFIYDLEKKVTYELPDSKFYSCCISGDYIYYTRNLTEAEMENDSLKDYYTWSWLYNNKPSSAMTQKAGKVYRVKIGENKEECVLQLTYKDVPVRIENISADGEMLYFSFRNHEQFKNYLNQDYAQTTTEPVTFAVADLQSGQVKVLDFTNAE